MRRDWILCLLITEVVVDVVHCDCDSDRLNAPFSNSVVACQFDPNFEIVLTGLTGDMRVHSLKSADVVANVRFEQQAGFAHYSYCACSKGLSLAEWYNNWPVLRVEELDTFGPSQSRSRWPGDCG